MELLYSSKRELTVSAVIHKASKASPSIFLVPDSNLATSHSLYYAFKQCLLYCLSVITFCKSLVSLVSFPLVSIVLSSREVVPLIIWALCAGVCWYVDSSIVCQSGRWYGVVVQGYLSLSHISITLPHCFFLGPIYMMPYAIYHALSLYSRIIFCSFLEALNSITGHLGLVYSHCLNGIEWDVWHLHLYDYQGNILYVYLAR